MDEINKMWEAYEKYKNTAEQHEFVRLFLMDARLVPAYNDLKKNYCDEHAEVFKRVLRTVLNSLGIKEE